MFRDEFLEATTDVWEMAPESATRVGHPAPFPVESPQRLIDLYTYKGDLVLDPSVGSGTTAVAAVRTGRHYVSYDTDPGSITAARSRVAAEVARLRDDDARRASPFRQVELTPVPEPADPAEDFQARAVREDRKAKELALMVLEHCGFAPIRNDVHHPVLGVEVAFVARDCHRSG